MNIPPDVSQLLDTYKNNYSAYRVSGNSANKTAYETAQKALNDKLEDQRIQLESGRSQIQAFLENHSDDSTVLDRLHEQSQAIQRDGPAIQNQYEISKRLNDSPRVQSVSDTNLYIKGSVVIGLLIIVGIAGAL
jgi:hypothetical protein